MGQDKYQGALQKPINSGFNAASTTSDEIKGNDHTGKTAIVTDGNPGAQGPVRPSFDPMVAAGLAAFEAGASEVNADNLIHMRQLQHDSYAVSLETLSCDDTFEVADILVPGLEPGAPDVPLLVCTPKLVDRPTPVFFYVHAGGMVLGDNRVLVTKFLGYASRFGMALVSVDYRLAPEHPHPAPVNDCYAGLLWLASHSEQLGIDPERIVVIGASAGGGLAAAITLMARDDASGPSILGQLLECPMLDHRNNTVSARSITSGDSWTHASNQYGWDALLGEGHQDREVSSYASPARANNFSNLPPTFIDVGSAEVFRDEAVAYASAIWAAGGDAELHVWPGGCHGFDVVAPTAAISQGALNARHAWLTRLLSETQGEEAKATEPVDE